MPVLTLPSLLAALVIVPVDRPRHRRGCARGDVPDNHQRLDGAHSDSAAHARGAGHVHAWRAVASRRSRALDGTTRIAQAKRGASGMCRTVKRCPTCDWPAHPNGPRCPGHSPHALRHRCAQEPKRGDGAGQNTILMGTLTTALRARGGWHYACTDLERAAKSGTCVDVPRNRYPCDCPARSDPSWAVLVITLVVALLIMLVVVAEVPADASSRAHGDGDGAAQCSRTGFGTVCVPGSVPALSTAGAQRQDGNTRAHVVQREVEYNVPGSWSECLPCAAALPALKI